MHEEQIDLILQKVARISNMELEIHPQGIVDVLSDIRHDLEELVANPSVTQEWVMIEDGGTYMVINTGVDGRVYCRGMEQQDAWELVRRLNGIEESC